MLRRLALVLLVLTGMLGVPALQHAQTGDEEKKWLGFWQCSHDGYTEYWNVLAKDGKFVVNGVFAKGKDISGMFTSADVTFKDGVLSFSRDWIKKPKSSDQDNIKITAKLVGDNLQYTARFATSTPTRTMTKLAQLPMLGHAPTDFLGVWKANHDGLDELLSVQVVGGKLTVQYAWLNAANIQVGAAVGFNPVINANGDLVFQQKFIKKAKGFWVDGCIITCKFKGENKIDYHWTTPGGSGGHRTMTMVPGTGVKLPPMPQPMVGDNSAFVGSFSGELEGFKEVWIITQENNEIAVKGVFLKNDKEEGSFVGKNVKLTDGKLTFTQQYTQKPAGVGWFDGANITVGAGPNSGLIYVWEVGAIKGTPRTLNKGR